jgi:hypothetical protein
MNDVAYFVVAGECKSETSRLHFIRSALMALPPANAMLAEFLLRHLSRVVGRAEQNKMHAQNVATIFGPVLLKATAQHSNIAHTGMVNVVTRELLTHVAALFDAGPLPFCAAGYALHAHAPPPEHLSLQMTFDKRDYIFFTARDESDWWTGVTWYVSALHTIRPFCLFDSSTLLLL